MVGEGLRMEINQADDIEFFRNNLRSLCGIFSVSSVVKFRSQIIMVF